MISKIRIFLKSCYTAAMISVIYSMLWLIHLSNKFFSFGYHDWDLALYSNLLWNMKEGTASTVMFGGNYLLNHSQYIAFLITPLYAIAPHPLTLITLKVLSVSGAAYILFLISRKLVGQYSLLIMLCYLLYPTNVFMLNFEFQFENLAIFFLTLAFYYLIKPYYLGYIISLALAALIKENICLIVLFFGLYVLFFDRKKDLKWSVIPILIGGGLFLLSIFVVTPYFRFSAGIETSNQYINMYNYILTSETGAFSIFNKVFSPENFSYFNNFFGFLWIYTILSPQALFIALPIFFQNLLSDSYQLKTIFYHYSATITPFLFISLVQALSFIKSILSSKQVLVGFFIIASCTISLLHSYSFKDKYKSILTYKRIIAPAERELLNLIPPQEPVLSSFEFLDSLSNRKELYPFYYVWSDRHIFTNQSPYKLPDYVRYAIIDLSSGWLINFAKIDQVSTVNRVSSFFDARWTPIKAYNDTVLFQKGSSKIPIPLISELPKYDPLHETYSVDEKLQLLNVELSFKNRLMNIDFYWKPTQKIEDLYLIQFYIKGDKGSYRLSRHFVGYLNNPPVLWKTGQIYKETYSMAMLEKIFEPGKEYEILGYIYNIKDDKPLTIKTKKDDITSHGWMTIGKVNITIK